MANSDTLKSKRDVISILCQGFHRSVVAKYRFQPLLPSERDSSQTWVSVPAQSARCCAQETRSGPDVNPSVRMNPDGFDQSSGDQKKAHQSTKVAVDCADSAGTAVDDSVAVAAVFGVDAGILTRQTSRS